MSPQTIFLMISILAFVILAVSLLFIRRKGKDRNTLSPFAGLAFAFIVAGIVFGEERWLGYGLIGIGVVLAFIDIGVKLRKNR